MNCRDERTPRRRARWLNKLYLLGAAVLLSGGLSAQVNYSYGWEPTGLGGWTGGGSRFTGATVCSGSAAVRRNLYSGVTTWDFVSPELGTSQGGLTTLTFNYKAAVWSANTVGVPAGAFTMNVQWGTSASGPWTTLGTIDGSNHVSSGSCAPGPGTYTFTPADGEAVYVRFQNAWVSGDYYLNFDDVVVVEQLPTCSGTDAPGATTGPSSVCADVAFDVGVTNTTPGDQVVYSWERSTTDGTSGFATFGAANAPTVNVTQAVPTWYRCTVTCNGVDPLTSSVLSVGMNAAQDCYCDGIVMGFDIEPICRVIFAGIDNSSCSGVNCDGDLVDYTGSVAPAEVAKGLSYPMTVTGNTAGNYTNNVTVYVDWDGNGTFESANTIGSFVNQTCAGAGVTGNLPVPLTAATGITRMRVYKHFGAAPADACTSVGFGQAEDYLLNVSEPPSCLFPSGFSAVPASASTATLSWTEPSPAPAIGYDWEIRSSGAPFSADPGLVEFGSIGAGNTSLVTTDGSLSIGATYTAYIRSDCDGETSDPVSATLAIIYCTAGATDPGFEKIVRVQFADVDNPSSSTAGYEDFSGISANVGTDVAIPFTITLNESYTSDRVLIWVDLNNNLVLTDPGE
ncbi:MAG: hypothetical protein KDB84_01585, partial [Flavobacteriales bacterium]|nr:hypothetical protein [Flavobacteriales bacterium]